MASSTIAFDIEVAGFPWEEVDEITRGYLLSREGEKERRESVPDRTGLYPGLGKIIAIGMWLIAEDRGLILLEGKSEETRDWSKVPGAKIFRGDERAILAEFWRLVARTPKAVTLATVKADALLKGSDLARLPRLSVMPFSEEQFARLMKLAGVS